MKIKKLKSYRAFKKVAICSTGLFLCLQIAAQESIQLHHRFELYGGVRVTPELTSSGFKNFELSDWKVFGSKGQNNTNEESRALFKLGEKEAKGAAIGISLGAGWKPNEKSRYFIAGHFTRSGDVAFNQFEMGYAYGLLVIRKFNLEAAPVVYWYRHTVNFGDSEFIEGYNDEELMVTTKGPFSEEDKVRIRMSGMSFGLDFVSRYALSDKLSIYLNAGWRVYNSQKTRIIISSSLKDEEEEEVGNIELSFSDPDVVQGNGSTANAGFSPTITSSGVQLTVGIVRRIF